MEHIDDKLFESSSTSSCRKDRVVPENLLEDSWFFGNSLHGRPKAMLRCFSHPSSSSSSSYISAQEMMVKKKISGGSSSGSGLVRSPSLPSSMAKEEGSERTRRSKSKVDSTHGLLRAPSLPPCIRREEEEEEEEDAESEFALSRLIRQASLNSDVLPPRHTPKGVKQGSSTAPRHRPRRRPDQETIDMDGCDQMRRQYLDQSKMRRSLSDLGEGFKDLGFRHDRKEMNETQPEEILTSPYQVSNWVDKSSSAEDMKAQIKFWARSVAANVR
ncbi:hypothetical protein NMG60_11037030 [Bertholletia excelsa]